MSGSETLRWDPFDFLSPAVDIDSMPRPNDWLHSNSLTYGPRGNVLISLRELDQVISIAPDFQSLEWRLGGPNSGDAGRPGRWHLVPNGLASMYRANPLDHLVGETELVEE